jgi:DNA-binding Lrp family transcriptional regulator
MERIKKLESAGIIRGYHAVLEARLLGLDVTAFIGVIASHPDKIGTLERQLRRASTACSSATTSPASTLCCSR